MARHIPGGMRVGKPVFDITKKFPRTNKITQKNKVATKVPKNDVDVNPSKFEGVEETKQEKRGPMKNTQNNGNTDVTPMANFVTPEETTTFSEKKSVEKLVMELEERNEESKNGIEETQTGTKVVNLVESELGVSNGHINKRSNKPELIEYAKKLGLEVNTEMTKKEIWSLVTNILEGKGN